MRLKSDVKLTRLSPQIFLGIMIAERVYTELGFEFVITSANDGKHMAGSKHYTGEAVDLRTKHLSPEQQNTVVGEIRARLGSNQFDVVLEKDHIHLEYDPKVT